MNLLKDKKSEIEILFQIIKVHVNEKFDVDIECFDKLKVKTRKTEYVYFRKLMMVIIGENFGKNYTQEEISSIVGLDRTSLIHHSKMHVNDYSIIPDYRKKYDLLRDEFLEKISSM